MSEDVIKVTRIAGWLCFILGGIIPTIYFWNTHLFHNEAIYLLFDSDTIFVSSMISYTGMVVVLLDAISEWESEKNNTK